MSHHGGGSDFAFLFQSFCLQLWDMTDTMWKHCQFCSVNRDQCLCCHSDSESLEVKDKKAGVIVVFLLTLEEVDGCQVVHSTFA